MDAGRGGPWRDRPQIRKRNSRALLILVICAHAGGGFAALAPHTSRLAALLARMAVFKSARFRTKNRLVLHSPCRRQAKQWNKVQAGTRRQNSERGQGLARGDPRGAVLAVAHGQFKTEK